MNYIVIARPVIGAAIGYVTNWIAVKMLFRPLKPVKIGKHTVPFTPGIIPKNKERIAKSIGKAISDNLLTEDVLIESLLSKEKEQKLRNKMNQIINTYKEKDETIENLTCKVIKEEQYNKLIEDISYKMQESIFKRIKEADIGDIVSAQIEKAAKEKMKGSILGVFGGNSIVENISEEASKKVDEYIDNNGHALVYKMVKKQIEKISNTRISKIIEKTENAEIDLSNVIIDIYRKITLEKLAELLKTINISQIVSDKINSMDMLELEKLILDIMKKELNALVNLGAIIGFALGCLNLLF